MARETHEQALARWAALEALQEHYTEFTDFMYDVMVDLLGFSCTEQQMDIGLYMQYGPSSSMVQAQRGQAKSTIAGCYAVWRLIHDPTARVVFLSAADTFAAELAAWAVQIIMYMPELECMRPCTSAGDRASAHAFDTHYSLRGAEKSPAIACRGITGQLQGLRADVLIADDIEAQSNASTEARRDTIRQISLDFTSICSTGKILYLGTPQSVDSTYNALPDRGYEVRIWPGRYPTDKELENYGVHLAPRILKAIKDNPSLQTGGGPTGDRGLPTDPELLNEDILTAKEIDQGPSHFQLQYMLDTRLMDIGRYPLHLNRIVFTPVAERMPVQLNFSPSTGACVPWPIGHPCKKQNIYYASGGSPEFSTFSGTYMYVDPSGGGAHGDELAWAVTRFMSGTIYLVEVGGTHGGIHDGNLDILTKVASKFKPQRIGVEKNYGNGALVQVWKPKLFLEHRCTIEEPWESGQKELRIIDILEPIIGSNRLVIDDTVVGNDWEQCQKYPADARSTYSLFYQMSRITRERASLLHDDRLDAVAGACRPWSALLAQDAKKVLERSRAQEADKLRKNPLSLPDYACTAGPSMGFGKMNYYDLHYRRK